MSTDLTTPALPDWQRDRLAVLLDAVGDVPISDAERRSLVWLAGWEKHTIENIAGLITRARATGPAQGGGTSPACLWCGCSPAPHRVHGDQVCSECHRGHRTA